MASSMISSENFVPGNVEFEAMGASDVDEALLMSLLEESQVEELQDERLGYVMRSLEAEIEPNTNTTEAPAPAPATTDLGIQDFGIEDGYDCSSGSYASPIHVFDWLDMDMEMASSSTCDDMGNWYMDSCVDELAGFVELGEVRDYSQFCYAAPMEEHAYGSLWQETYDSVMYD
ncbi:hypothetical protein NE237_001869 [Protea cynaroides]|uniref:Uncharacterized protein n=1 Tax=Protea cynaroides TaxID=273540 RepID=A0A9Q0KTX6_9MAGN|nr:hypothetical protein NE237_001869 [Protea cynaroides]